jgi:glycine cleavage system regulatory protein
MKTSLILSAIGSDRPGLTQALADAVLAAGGNWLESHLSRLGGKYVGAVLVELDSNSIPDLTRAVQGVDAVGLHVSIVPAAAEAEPVGELLLLELIGQDRVGIVREVTAALAQLGVNLEDFSTRVENSSWSGGRLFRLNGRLRVPANSSPDEVRVALEAISAEIMVDFTVSAPDER